jgi:hypothetical protein
LEKKYWALLPFHTMNSEGYNTVFKLSNGKNEYRFLHQGGATTFIAIIQ